MYPLIIFSKCNAPSFVLGKPTITYPLTGIFWSDSSYFFKSSAEGPFCLPDSSFSFSYIWFCNSLSFWIWFFISDNNLSWVLSSNEYLILIAKSSAMNFSGVSCSSPFQSLYSFILEARSLSSLTSSGFS